MNIIKIREDLHQIPEIGKKEYETKKYILNIVKNYKCKIFEIEETGVVLYFDFNKEESICLRSDMDALPILEKNNVSYQSKNKGMSHACGHDGHMAMLLGIVDYINTLEDYPYNIVCLFQPSEEIYGGAKSIVDSGILDKLKVKYMFGMHLWPNLPKGELFTMPLGMLAKSSEVNINIRGKSVHAANKKMGTDSIKIACEYLLDLYQLEEKILERHLLHFGKISGGTLRNIVALNTTLKATMRAFDEATFNILKNNLYEVAQGYEEKYSCLFDIEVNEDFPCVYNNQELVEKMGFAKILKEPFMQAEDFGLYTTIYPSCFFLLGIGATSPLHTDTFDFDSKVLLDGLNYYKKILEVMSNGK